MKGWISLHFLTTLLCNASNYAIINDTKMVALTIKTKGGLPCTSIFAEG